MVRLHREFEPLDDAKIKTLAQELSNPQGNILRGHGRDHAMHIFLTFKQGENEREEVKRWIREVIAKRVTDATQQREDAEAYKKQLASSEKNKEPASSREDLFCGFFLSASGYKLLNMEPPDDVAFKKGLWDRWKELYIRANNDASLNDSLIYSDWDNHNFDKHINPAIHAMIMLASDKSLSYLDTKMEEFTGASAINQSAIAHCFTEDGSVIRHDYLKSAHKTFEHFGFRDNISQPLFFTEDLRKISGGTSKWNPGAGPNLVLVQDPHAPAGEDKEHAHGSYLVFLKLEQHVDVFRDYPGDKVEFMGRDEQGAPLLNRKKGKQLGGINNFNYFREAREPGNQKLELEPLPPFSSHIRRMNPRGEHAVSNRMPSTYDRQRRIARRGISYGSEYSSEKGMLFMCYQADITRQFEYLLLTAQQSNYIAEDYIHRNYRTYDYETESVKCDAIIGRLIEIEGVNYALPRFVTLRGGEYFFAPSIPCLRKLQ